MKKLVVVVVLCFSFVLLSLSGVVWAKDLTKEQTKAIEELFRVHSTWQAGKVTSVTGTTDEVFVHYRLAPVRDILDYVLGEIVEDVYGAVSEMFMGKTVLADQYVWLIVSMPAVMDEVPGTVWTEAVRMRIGLIEALSWSRMYMLPELHPVPVTPLEILRQLDTVWIQYWVTLVLR